jgi:hypothetical protein
MRPSLSRLIVNGVFGGVAAGAVVVVWFLVVDLVAGQPLATPTLLASTFLGRPIAEPTIGVIAGYTILHFGVFAILGIVAAVALNVLEIEPGLRHGLVFGVGVFNAVHYGTLVVMGARMLTLLPGIHVVLANFVGGMLMMVILHHQAKSEKPLGLGALREHPLLREGVGTGVVGALAVAVWFLVLDVMSGRPLFTPAALGSALFLGAATPADVQVNLVMIGAYTVVHFLAFAAAGTALVWMTRRLEQRPGLWLAALMALIILDAGFIGVAGVLGGWILGALGWWAVLVGNLLAVGVMGRQLWRAHPGLSKQLSEEPVTTMV